MQWISNVIWCVRVCIDLCGDALRIDGGSIHVILSIVHWHRIYIHSEWSFIF